MIRKNSVGWGFPGLICLCLLAQMQVAGWAQEFAEDYSQSSRRYAAYRTFQPEQEDPDDAPVLPPTVVEEDEPAPEPPPEPPQPPQPPAAPPALPEQQFDLRTDFRVENSAAALNVDAPLIETPATVNVLTEGFLDTIAIREFQDALQYVPGVGVENTNATGPAFNIRGFQSQVFDPSVANGGNSIRIDDFRALARRYHFDPTLYERIDVLKGTSSLLYGTASPGGLIRFVTKKPQFEPFYRVEGRLGSFDTARATFDATGPVNEERTLAYRLITTVFDSNQPFHGQNDDISFDNRFIVNPQLAWLTPTGGLLQMRYEYSIHEGAADPGIKRLNDGTFTFNTNPFLGPDSFIDRETHLASMVLSQPLGVAWELELGGAFGHSEDVSLWDRAINPLTPTDFFRRETRRHTEDFDGYELRAELDGDFYTSESVRHQLTLGLNYINGGTFATRDRVRVAGVIDGRNPVFGPALPANVLPPPFAFETNLDQFAAYVQDYVSVGESLNFFGGLRFTDAETSIRTSGGQDTGTDEALDYTVGTILNWNDFLNPFASYSTALSPQTGALESGESIPFREAEQIELGLKSEWLDGLLLTTASVFEITQTNIAESPDGDFFILVGDQRTRGFEFEAVGKLSDQVRVYGGYSYLDAVFTKSTIGVQGNTPFSVPRNKFSLYLTYDVYDGSFTGWRPGIGFIHVGERFGDNSNNFELPSYNRLDLSLAYFSPHNGSYFRMSIENVVNQDYISASSGFGDFTQGTPRFFTMTAGLEY